MAWLISLAALLMSLFSQVSSGAVVHDDGPLATRLAALRALTVVCHSGLKADSPSQPAHSPFHHGADHALCPVCASLTLPGVVLLSGPLLPEPAGGLIGLTEIRPPTRAPPPVWAAVSCYPRGPPRLV